MSAAALSERALVSLTEARRHVYRNEDDASRDELLVDAINLVSGSIWDHCRREFKRTSTRKGTDGVANSTTTFVSATAAFTTDDVGKPIDIPARGVYTIVSRTNATTVVLSGSPATGTGLSWYLSEARIFAVAGDGWLDLSPYDLRQLVSIVRDTDREVSLQQTLTTAQYRLGPAGASTYMSARLPAATLLELEPGFGWQATITGLWGMATVPDAVKLACLQWVDNIVKNPGAWASNAMSGYSVTPDTDFASSSPAGMPAAVRHRLAYWRREPLVA